MIINILFCLFALYSMFNFMRNVSRASGIDRGVQAPDVTLVQCASSNTRTSSENLVFNFWMYALWATGSVAGALFYIFANTSWGGIVAAIAGAANIFAIRSVLGATRRFMDRYADEEMSHLS